MTLLADQPKTSMWSHVGHDWAMSRAYTWGGDGIAGFGDDHQRRCFVIALWNGVDRILKERMFGLTNAVGNHGEDVKECHLYLDAAPTSSHRKYRGNLVDRGMPQ